MELSKKERLFLYNQYEILKLLNSEDQHMVDTYNTNQEIVLNGYKHEYDNLIDWVLDDTPDDISNFVWDVFNMFRSLYGSYRQLSKDEKDQINLDDITYQGFDGNDECDYYVYANFILQTMGRYGEIYNNGEVELNSHRNMVNTYKNMLSKWEEVRDNKYSNLSTSQITDIINSRFNH